MGERIEHFRILIDKQSAAQNELDITDKGLVKKLVSVQRLRSGDRIYVVVPFHGESKWRVESVDKKKIRISFLEQTRSYTPPAAKINLFISAVPARKLVHIITSAVELGVNEINIMQTRHSNVQIARLNRERLKDVIEQAVLQSKRLDIPGLNFFENLKEALDYSAKRGARVLVFHQDAEERLRLDDLKEEIMDLYIGPEGGFAEDELSMLPVQPVKVYNSTLRVETAVVSFLSVITYLKLDKSLFPTYNIRHTGIGYGGEQ